MGKIMPPLGGDADNIETLNPITSLPEKPKGKIMPPIGGELENLNQTSPTHLSSFDPTQYGSYAKETPKFPENQGVLNDIRAYE